MKNIYFILLALLAVLALWGLHQVLGEYLYLFLLGAAILQLLINTFKYKSKKRKVK
jgi:hypothetical protein